MINQDWRNMISLLHTRLHSVSQTFAGPGYTRQLEQAATAAALQFDLNGNSTAYSTCIWHLIDHTTKTPHEAGLGLVLME